MTPHTLETSFDTGEGWKAICSCTWECWDRANEADAEKAWMTHAVLAEAREAVHRLNALFAMSPRYRP